MITSSGCPYKVLGDPWEVLGEGLEGPWCVAGGSLGVRGGLRGLLGIFVNKKHLIKVIGWNIQ